MDFDEAYKLTISNVKDIISLGFSHENTFIFSKYNKLTIKGDLGKKIFK
jgi:hypothetical protein